MTQARPWRNFTRDLGGAAAVETALVLPAFVLMIVGGLATADLGFAASSLHFAVEDAARCAAVQTTVCSGGSATTAFAANRYNGPSISPVFTYATTGCGHTVSATGTFSLNLIAQMMNIPVAATACYP